MPALENSLDSQYDGLFKQLIITLYLYCICAYNMPLMNFTLKESQKHDFKHDFKYDFQRLKTRFLPNARSAADHH